MMSEAMILDVMRQQGKADAIDLRARAKDMDGTAVIAESIKAPKFDGNKDYTSWPVGSPVWDDGQVYTLLQPYNAKHYQGTPATLRAMWSITHTKDPAKALPYLAPLGISGIWLVDECCTENGHVYRNKYANNDFPPSAVPARWEDLGTIEEIQK